MRRQNRARHGEGTAWLVVDRIKGDKVCDWYTDAGDGRLVERARAAQEPAAWGRQRNPRVRIHIVEAGFSPAPPSPGRDDQNQPSERRQLVGAHNSSSGAGSC
jgi:hypothetical protein